MSEGKHFFMWLGAICIFSYELSVHIFITYYIFKSVVGLFSVFRRSLDIKDIKPLFMNKLQIVFPT